MHSVEQIMSRTYAKRIDGDGKQKVVISCGTMDVSQLKALYPKLDVPEWCHGGFAVVALKTDNAYTILGAFILPQDVVNQNAHEGEERWPKRVGYAAKEFLHQEERKQESLNASPATIT